MTKVKSMVAWADPADQRSGVLCAGGIPPKQMRYHSFFHLSTVLGDQGLPGVLCTGQVVYFMQECGFSRCTLCRSLVYFMQKAKFQGIE